MRTVPVPPARGLTQISASTDRIIADEPRARKSNSHATPEDKRGNTPDFALYITVLV
jgi:hypothetical protein